jgi:hypothetical protein
MSWVRRPSRRASVPSYAAPTCASATSSSRGAWQPPNGYPTGSLVGAAGRLPDEIEGGEQFDVYESHGSLPMRSLSRPGGRTCVGEADAHPRRGVRRRTHRCGAPGFVLGRWWAPVVVVPGGGPRRELPDDPGSGLAVMSGGPATDPADAERGPSSLLLLAVRSVAASDQGAAPGGRAFTHSPANVTPMTSARRRGQPYVCDPEGRIPMDRTKQIALRVRDGVRTGGLPRGMTDGF